jgi:polysaccharide deacetylase 2 family uncharacterized protein YibQ
MIKNIKLRARVKNYLLALNFIMSLVLLSLIIYWIASVRPSQIERAIGSGQYRLYMMDNLPNGDNEIEPDYIGIRQNIADTTEEIIEIERELAAIDDSPPDVNFSAQEQDNIKQGDLLEKTNEFLGKKVSVKNAKHEKKKKHAKNPKISIIVTNLGLNRRLTELALTLPKECALGFLPYTKSLKPLLSKAQKNGNEIYIYLPLQTSKSDKNEIKYALMSNLGQEENTLRLNMILNSHTKYNGVYSNYKEVFTDNSRTSKSIFEYLNDKDLIFILGKGLQSDALRHLNSHDNIMPTDIIIDEEPDKEYILRQLKNLANIAQEEGVALGYAQSFNITIEMIKKWIPILKQQGIKLVPVSVLLKEYNS